MRAGRMALRRCVLLAIALAATLGLGLLLAHVLAFGGWTGWKIAILACFAGTVPWMGLGPGNGLIGTVILLGARWPARAVLPVAGAIDAGAIDAAPVTARTAIAVTVRNEDMAAVIPPLSRLLDGLRAAGKGASFALFVLSDTSDPALAAAEAAALAAFPEARYRRRNGNAGFKAGNVMDFLDHHADGFDLALMLDADSEMTAAAVLRLVRIMQAAPGMGIVQHLTVGRAAASAFPRLFQFGMRAGMRSWAVGQAWWQGDEGPYWGHNAILRIGAFRAHGRLPSLPDGGAILSHDQVEAARLRGAGWGVCVWAEEAGSTEANPPTLIEFLRRDARWMAGNMQYRHLLRMPGLRPMGRWQLIQAMLLFSGGPLYTAMLVLAAISVATGGGATVPRGAMLALAVAWPWVVYAPKWLGYLEVLAVPRNRARYGGTWPACAGMAAETVFALLLDAIQLPHKALAIARVIAGAQEAWLPQNRVERGVGWSEAVRVFWPHTLLGVVVFALLARGAWGAVLWAAPFAGGLLVAIPFCVATSAPRFSGWLRRHRVAAMPEELSGETPTAVPDPARDASATAAAG